MQINKCISVPTVILLTFILQLLCNVAVSFADCSGRNPLEGPLKGELENALALAERFTQQYNGLLRRFEEQMANTSFILDLLNSQFGWVSSLANQTNTKDDIFQVKAVCIYLLNSLLSPSACVEQQTAHMGTEQTSTFYIYWFLDQIGINEVSLSIHLEPKLQWPLKVEPIAKASTQMKKS